MSITLRIEMNSHQLDKLSKIASKGKWHYILFHGAIGWGVTTAVLFSLLQSFISEVEFTDNIWLALIIFPLGGIGWGAFMWSYYQKKVNKINSNEL